MAILKPTCFTRMEINLRNFMLLAYFHYFEKFVRSQLVLYFQQVSMGFLVHKAWVNIHLGRDFWYSPVDN
jgi:hypothetical protein